MTWKEFKDRVESLGVTDSDIIEIRSSAASAAYFAAEDILLNKKQNDENPVSEIY